MASAGRNRIKTQVLSVRMAVAVVSICCAPAARFAAAGDRLQWTGGVTEIEGSAGGGLVPWALIGGLETNTEIGATGFVDYVSTADFNLRSAGAGVDLQDRVELSVARQRFDAGSVSPGLTLGQDILGVKVRLAGDAVFAPDEYLPQIAIGAQWKHTLDFDEIPREVGAASGEDVEFYLAATKLYFGALAGHNVILDATLRRTRANQFGLLGFGGNDSGYTFRPELSAAVWLSDQILLGAEYRSKPDNLRPFREDSARDVFLAWGPLRNVTFTTAWTDLGPIAGKTTQSGIYASLWVGF
jgi:Protein of unknown function (DUF3034)